MTEQNTFSVIYDGVRIEVKDGETMFIAKVADKVIGAYSTFNRALDEATIYVDQRREKYGT